VSWHPTSRTAFFVGYLKMPGPLALFLWGLLPLLLGGIVGAAVALAVNDTVPQPAGGAIGSATLTGVVQLAPYPMLRLPPDGAHAEPRTVLVIQPGKNGAQGRLAGLDGATVAADGLVYERDGQQLFELAGGAEAVRTVDAVPGFAPAAARSLGTHALSGEIVDPKCFLGAMRPGERKPHMMCGNRCLFGGIPPMLAVRDGEGALSMLLLLGPGGEATLAPFEDWTSLPARLTGEVSALDGLLIMRVAADGVIGL
jgi:hypothetical protein